VGSSDRYNGHHDSIGFLGSLDPIMSRILHLTRLYNRQNGMCWICGLPMHQPKQGKSCQPPHAYAATIDHLEPKRLRLLPNRPTKAAHRICNNLRGHMSIDDPKMQNHIKAMHLKFARSRLANFRILEYEDSNKKTGPEEENQSTNSEPAPFYISLSGS
jgi:hypothetical protein